MSYMTSTTKYFPPSLHSIVLCITFSSPKYLPFESSFQLFHKYTQVYSISHNQPVRISMCKMKNVSFDAFSSRDIIGHVRRSFDPRFFLFRTFLFSNEFIHFSMRDVCSLGLCHFLRAPIMA
ncbi:hypothetical protein CAEBREN_05140 [Caenorhabditis brenneri]|uniref:Uncharacterized protein n=1 Tax=Caenorhabditis brenneri TaxID=135651 RepID=G0M8C8_CAEBE|nr:hypothetical protein CAEBREN_05140 [Caenorhabditis brenneri]